MGEIITGMNKQTQKTRWQQMIARFRLFLWTMSTRWLAPEMLRELYLGILGREPDPDGLRHYTEALAQKKETFQHLVAVLVASFELRRKIYAQFSPGLARACFLGVLNREPDEAGLQTYTARLSREENLQPVLRELIASHEFKRTFIPPTPAPDPAQTYEAPTWAFLHIEKTAGTALQNLLVDAFPPGAVLGGHAHLLFVRSAGELSKYTVFAGHFNHDELSYIPRKSISRLTFVREPAARLSSLYHFLRAHEPEHESSSFETKLANELNMETYYRDSRIQAAFWNRMTWAVMGQRQWLTWQLHLSESGQPAFSDDFIATVVRPAMRQRLLEFSFVGLQEDYDRAVEALFKVLGKPMPAALPRDHSLEMLIKLEPNFKRQMPRQSITPSCLEAMEAISQLDQVLYQEAKLRYSELLEHEPQILQPVETPPSPVKLPVPI
jgi:hypothetical protein